MPINFNELSRIPLILRPVGAGPTSNMVMPEAASSNFRRGEIVILSTSAGIDYCANMATRPASGAASSSVSTGQLYLGFALDDAAGVTGTPINIAPANRVECLMRVYASPASAAEIQDVAISDLGEFFRYNIDSSNLNVIPVISAAPNGTDGINGGVIVGKYDLNMASTNSLLVGEQAIDDDYGLVWVRIRSTLCAFDR